MKTPATNPQEPDPGNASGFPAASEEPQADPPRPDDTVKRTFFPPIQRRQAATAAPAARPDGPVSAWEPVARGLALFFAMFSLLNLLSERVSRPGVDASFDTSQWWINFYPLPAMVQWVALVIVTVFLLGYALRPRCASWRRRATMIILELFMVIAIWDAFVYYWLLGSHALYGGPWLAFSFLVLAGLRCIWRSLANHNRGPKPGHAIPIIGCTVFACAVVFPLAQMWCFGRTDYRRQCDAVVVFGAGVRPDGTPSQALEDRVNLACQLYNEHLVGDDHWTGKLIFTGGQGPDEPRNEVDVMRDLALAAGVPDKAIILDPHGDNTAASIAHTGAIFQKLARQKNENALIHGWPTGPLTIMAVSHFWHLPRIKMTYQRDLRTVRTVPVRRELVSTPKYMAREVVALWKYYFGTMF